MAKKKLVFGFYSNHTSIHRPIYPNRNLVSSYVLVRYYKISSSPLKHYHTRHNYYYSLHHLILELTWNGSDGIASTSSSCPWQLSESSSFWQTCHSPNLPELSPSTSPIHSTKRRGKQVDQLGSRPSAFLRSKVNGDLQCCTQPPLNHQSNIISR